MIFFSLPRRIRDPKKYLPLSSRHNDTKYAIETYISTLPFLFITRIHMGWFLKNLTTYCKPTYDSQSFWILCIPASPKTVLRCVDVERDTGKPVVLALEWREESDRRAVTCAGENTIFENGIRRWGGVVGVRGRFEEVSAEEFAKEKGEYFAGRVRDLFALFEEVWWTGGKRVEVGRWNEMVGGYATLEEYARVLIWRGF
ncbi:hypothetical protein HDV00_009615 [Rhizophlyctis rosea]|nr:hypothetical protein HDV00_009615 [Rhizophlyctis rosea]